MADYESDIKHSVYNNDIVYAKLSDLSTLSTLQERLSQPGAVEMLMSRIPEEHRKTETIQQAIDGISKLKITTDSLTYPASPIGDITLAIIEREAPKCVKFELQGAPIQAYMWVQLLPSTDGGTRLKITVRADLNFMMKAMIGNKVKHGVDALATMLAQLPYTMI